MPNEGAPPEGHNVAGTCMFPPNVEAHGGRGGVELHGTRRSEKHVVGLITSSEVFYNRAVLFSVVLRVVYMPTLIFAFL